MTDAPIGIFDSGVGGLTVARAVKDQLPNESILYVGDLEHSPYGPKKIADVRGYALAVLDDLVAQGVKMLVIACNTASAAMLRDARERYDVPVVEVIQPAVRRAVATTRRRPGRRHRHGGHHRVARLRRRVRRGAAPRAVLAGVPALRRVRRGGRHERRRAVRRRRGVPRAALARADVDTLVLGCTHYPFLKGAISYVMGEQVSLVSSDVETANDVYRVLVSNGMERRASDAAHLPLRGDGRLDERVPRPRAPTHRPRDPERRARRRPAPSPSPTAHSFDRRTA